MSLSPGGRLGPYEIVAAIGAGGMGEVYRARDTKLQRDVAIKVLPPLFARDPERLARFEREARTLAALNHPHIAQVYGIESGALVMEFVDGEDLSQRIARAGAIPLDEALPMAVQIAEAVECAHEQGIIHRDLKPANIKVRPDGSVKVLDFGLAKALAPVDPAAHDVNVHNSPTITSPFSMSALGVILGTAAYMAPEQAKGKPVDKRSDIWAFGCVLYELLTGRRAFKGDDVSETLAAVLRDEVDLRALPEATPASLRRLLARCLERNPKQRLRDIGEARIELAKIESGAVDIREAQTQAAPPGTRGAPAWVPWTIAGIATGAFVTLLTMWAPWRSVSVPLPIRLSAEIGADAAIDPTLGAAAIISPDGRTLVFTAMTGNERRLYVRRIDQLGAMPLAGTEGAANPFFSPDGQSVAFFASGWLKTMAVAGGAITSVCAVDGTARGGWWSDDETIVFQPTTRPAPLMRVPAAGGTPTAIGTLEQGEVTRRWPQVLPGARAVLYTSSTQPTGFDNARVVVQPLSGGAPKTIVQGGFYGRYVPTGHILYLQGATLFALPFDLDRLEASGRAVPLLDGVFGSPTTGGGQFSVSATGTLVYFPGRGSAALRPMFWMNRAGEVTPLRVTPSEWINPRFSPDGDKLTMSIIDAGQLDVWTYDWRRDRSTKLTFDAAAEFGPIWTPDGARIVFSSDRAAKGITNLYWMRADGVGDVQRLTDAPNRQVSYSVHRSGKWVAFQETRPATAGDVMVLPIEGDEATGWKPGTPRPFVATAANELAPMFSPDGRWIAYMSNETNLMQVYVRPFPDADGKWQISTSGPAIYPTWSRTRPELLFIDATSRKMMAASYTIKGTSFYADRPHEWSPHELDILGTTRMYDLHPDGERLAMLKPTDTDMARRDKIVFVFNFLDTLRHAAPQH